MEIPHNNDIPVIIDERFVTFSISSHIRGYHAYMYFWVPTVEDDSLVCKREENSANYDNAVGIMCDDLVTSRIVGHVPQNDAPVFARFSMLPNHSIRCCVTDTVSIMELVSR